MSCQIASFSHTRGASFQLMARIPSRFVDGHFMDWAPTSQVRTEKGDLVAELEVTWDDPATARVLVLRSLDTSAWAIGAASFDVRLTAPDGFVLHTTPVPFYIVKGVTSA